jgi:hypothetical protein
VESSARQGTMKSLSLLPGDAYLLHASTVLHRVTGLEEESDMRMAFNFAYCLSEDQEYGSSASLLYGRVAEAKPKVRA